VHKIDLLFILFSKNNTKPYQIKDLIINFSFAGKPELLYKKARAGSMASKS